HPCLKSQSLFCLGLSCTQVPGIVSLKTARIGDTVTLHCGAREENRTSLFWYKQSIGYVPQKVASIVSSYVTFFPPFDSSFNVNEPDIDLNIRSVSKEDEANYFCQKHYSNYWSGFFLFVSQTVVQQPVSASVQLGDPVALQCSITSQRTDHSDQCQGEPSVYWFRSGPSHPAAIYMNGNRSGECQNSSGPSAPQSCVYTLPKNNVDSSDAGTYYCALAACGAVMFGNGTKLDLTVTVVLGILLACCLVVIIILLLTRNKKQVCEYCKGLYLLKI
uniref:Ig-like domain-containing protein n=1 Tax=Gadus morhua TaxID=8049 RepID=A0A8C5A3T1_GADMO